MIGRCIQKWTKMQNITNDLPVHDRLYWYRRIHTENGQFPFQPRTVPVPRNQTFIISYFTPTTEYKNVQYMYGKLSLRALHTCIERDLYYRSYGVRFEKFGKKGPFLSVIIRGFALKKKKKLYRYRQSFQNNCLRTNSWSAATSTGFGTSSTMRRLLGLWLFEML